MSILPTVARQLVKAKPCLELSKRCMSGDHYVTNTYEMYLARIGTREIVTYGKNGIPFYMDARMFPFSSIRYREDTPEIKALREKEKGDWKNLTIEEKKILYRASFCQTYAEFTHPTGKWKQLLGLFIGWMGMVAWAVAFIHSFVLRIKTYDEEKAYKQIKYMIDIRDEPAWGIASKWDYDKMQWKDQE